jgi:hypothetical protein
VFQEVSRFDFNKRQRVVFTALASPSAMISERIGKLKQNVKYKM